MREGSVLTLSLQRREVSVLESLKGMLMCSKRVRVGIKRFLEKGGLGSGLQLLNRGREESLH